MEPASSDGVSIIGYLQPQFNHTFYNDEDAGKLWDDGHNNAENSFLFNRARLGVTGNIPYDFSYYALAEFSPFQGGPAMLDFFVTYKGLGPWAQISMGQFKQPFGLELTTACHALHTIDRSLVVRSLAAPFRDLGVMVSGGTDTLEIFGLKNKNIFSYSLAYTNGTGINLPDSNLGKDFIGRLVFSPWDFISIGGSYRYGQHKNPVDSITTEDSRMRWGADLTLKVRDLLIQGEYIFGRNDGSIVLPPPDCSTPPQVIQGSNEADGYWVLAQYNTPWYLQPVVKYATYDANIGTEFNQVSTLTFGFNYFFNDWTRLQVNYQYNTEESGSELADYHEVANDMLMVQVQIRIQ